MEKLIKKHADKIRFLMVGGTNTVIDFVILFSLFNFLGLPKLYSNIISTSIALTFSLFANKTFTFKDKSKSTKKQTIRFLVITLFGLWVIQTIIIEGVKIIIGQSITDNNLILVIGKLIATCFTLVWNYLMYRKFVFNNNTDQEA